MARFSILIALALVLAGCAGGEKIKATPQFQRIECKRYSIAEQKKLLDDLDHLAEQFPEVAGLVDDYGSLRAAVCRK